MGFNLDAISSADPGGGWSPELTPVQSRLQTRRATLGLVAGTAALAATAAPSLAAYGDSANVFGKITNKSGECRSHETAVFAVGTSPTR